MRAVAAEVGLHLETVIASIREPSDFAGLPIRVGSSVSFAPPRWAQAVVDHGGGIVVYNEVSTAPPAVQAALLRPILVVAVPTSDAHEGGFPTPRSWEMAGRLLAVARARACAPAVTRKLVAGCVGAGAAAELLYYLEHLDVPAPQDVLADPDGWEMPSQRGDVVDAVVASALSLAASLRTRESCEAAGVVLARIAEAGFVDVAYDAGRTWIRERPDGALPATRTLLALQPLLADVRPAREPGP